MVLTGSSAAWFDHLSDGDRDLLRRVASRIGTDPGDLGDTPDALARVLAHPLAFESVFSAGGEAVSAIVSPFLTFAVVVHRAWDELQHVSHVDEWVGPRQRLPVLGGGDLREFLAAPSRRLFLTELLASYTRVASGVVWVHTRRGWRRRRFSELDPARLASMLDVISDEERPGVYRRLGDLCLFLTGVFPDHTETNALAPVDIARLVRLSGPGDEAIPERRTLGGTGTVSLLERLGQRWYRSAVHLAHPLTAQLQLVADVSERFGAARRTLNYVTDRYLFERRADWFGTPDP